MCECFIEKSEMREMSFEVVDNGIILNMPDFPGPAVFETMTPALECFMGNMHGYGTYAVVIKKDDIITDPRPHYQAELTVKEAQNGWILKQDKQTYIFMSTAATLQRIIEIVCLFGYEHAVEIKTHQMATEELDKLAFNDENKPYPITEGQ